MTGFAVNIPTHPGALMINVSAFAEVKTSKSLFRRKVLLWIICEFIPAAKLFVAPLILLLVHQTITE